ncbi:MAG: hypothetical protein AB8G05_18405 [Oligoflexales bacterium]
MFFQACVNSKIFLGEVANWLSKNPADIVNKWYPLKVYIDLCDAVNRFYPVFDPVFFKIGREMMKIWYQGKDGKLSVKSAVDFINLQTSSESYRKGEIRCERRGKRGGTHQEIKEAEVFYNCKLRNRLVASN